MKFKIKNIIKKKTNKNIINQNKKKTAIGYFDVDGNLILETYNPKTDTISFQKYIVTK